MAFLRNNMQLYSFRREDQLSVKFTLSNSIYSVQKYFDQNSRFLTVFWPYLFKKAQLKKNSSYLKYWGPYRIKQISNIFSISLAGGNHIPKAVWDTLPPDILGGDLTKSSRFFTVFCPYLFKKTRIFKNSSCMKLQGVYRIKQVYNIF